MIFNDEESVKSEIEQSTFFNKRVNQLSDDNALLTSLPLLKKKYDFLFNEGSERGHGLRVAINMLGGEEIFKDKRVLDFGCATGDMGIYFGMLGAQVAGFDIAQNRVRIANRRAEVNQLKKVKFTTASARRLPYTDNYFDYIFGNAILHHVIDLPGVNEELKRVLKKDGICIFHDSINEVFFWKWIRMYTISRWEKRLGEDPGERVTYVKDFLEFGTPFSKVEIHYMCFLYMTKRLFRGRMTKQLSLLLKWFYLFDCWVIDKKPSLKKICGEVLVILKK